MDLIRWHLPYLTWRAATQLQQSRFAHPLDCKVSQSPNKSAIKVCTCADRVFAAEGGCRLCTSPPRAMAVREYLLTSTVHVLAVSCLPLRSVNIKTLVSPSFVPLLFTLLFQSCTTRDRFSVRELQHFVSCNILAVYLDTLLSCGLSCDFFIVPTVLVGSVKVA